MKCSWDGWSQCKKTCNRSAENKSNEWEIANKTVQLSFWGHFLNKCCLANKDVEKMSRDFWTNKTVVDTFLVLWWEQWHSMHSLSVLRFNMAQKTSQLFDCSDIIKPSCFCAPQKGQFALGHGNVWQSRFVHQILFWSQALKLFFCHAWPCASSQPGKKLEHLNDVIKLNILTHDIWFSRRSNETLTVPGQAVAPWKDNHSHPRSCSVGPGFKVWLHMLSSKPQRHGGSNNSTSPQSATRERARAQLGSLWAQRQRELAIDEIMICICCEKNQKRRNCNRRKQSNQKAWWPSNHDEETCLEWTGEKRKMCGEKEEKSHHRND